MKPVSNNYIGIFYLFFMLAVFFQIPFALGQKIYVKTFGDTSSIPVLYLHGGPGYNCSTFEVTSAQKLADEGYYVVVYDRRGEGRSGESAAFTFEQTHADLVGIMDSLRLKSANLIGHSFGGMVAITFAEKHKDLVQSIVLIGAPVSLQESFKTIINSCEKIYEATKDETNLSYITMLKAMDPSSIEYSSYCFMHALQNGFYSPEKPTKKAKQLYKLFKSDPVLIEYASKMGYKQPQGFWQNEAYTTMDLSENIRGLIKHGVNIVGMYGKEDGLYSNQQIINLKEILGDNKVQYLEDCSHNVYIDQQELFIEALNNWIK